MVDDPWFSPTFKFPIRKPTPGEPVWSLRKAGETLTCELRGQGEFGWEAQTFRNGEFHSGRRFDLHAQALHYANVLRGDFERVGWIGGSDGAAGPQATGPCGGATTE